MTTATGRSPQRSVRRSADRGRGEHGWLSSRHSFSFANYYDPDHMGFGHLRVINEDHVRPGAGFGRHGHRDMEIITFVVTGELAHQDSTGERGTLRYGDIQVMSAGRGIEHSEFNASAEEPVQFIQIWVEPAQRGGEPSYQQRFIEPSNGLSLLVSPDGADGSLTIRQDASIYRGVLDAEQALTVDLLRPRTYLHLVRGELSALDVALKAGDALALTHHPHLKLFATEPAEFLLFDLAE
ncbi:MAG: pirin family protein [Myxococcota bacterium]|nr:pirin family protein [Myxococcota bacterium]